MQTYAGGTGEDSDAHSEQENRVSAFHVGAGTFIWVTDLFDLNDCSTYTTSAEIISKGA